ncbi:hypothetical protein C9I57_22470 [Trinickia symbiotica]|uniref:Tannase/feruloyl esterase family alpha/beta hydrolase n=1 Tax=Trinickia symbiotica TaxID=863227 RepID=A0A2T3XPD2_9BURK|nr:hypothetical protein [Trinickia symbiotica]PTB18375.1 hypothetical protein C9I57_22470 [Trinickia symbiotica]
MPSLPFTRLAKRAFAAGLALTLQAALAAFGAPSAALAEGMTDVCAADARTPFAAACALDDSMLARQRGGHAGMVTIAALPDASPGANSVTLWDELARPAPAPLPMPVDTTGAVQSNAVNYTRK